MNVLSPTVNRAARFTESSGKGEKETEREREREREEEWLLSVSRETDNSSNFCIPFPSSLFHSHVGDFRAKMRNAASRFIRGSG